MVHCNNISKNITISAIGDISFMSVNGDELAEKVFSSIASIFTDADFVVANLESPLLVQGESVSGKCTLHGNPGWAAIMRDAGVNLVSLANNHLMDFGIDGLMATTKALNAASIMHVGAGNNIKEANAPVFAHIGQVRIAYLARTSVVVASPCYAGANLSGVACLDVEETKRNIRACKKQADLVILLIHWGLEGYAYPSPSQRIIASELINAGVDVILGHHPHVLQGVEKFGDTLVCYSLGNFVFDDVPWSFIDENGLQQNRIVKLMPGNRKGGMVNLCLFEGRVESFEFIPTYIRSNRTVSIDNTLERKRQFDRLCSNLNFPVYNQLWRFYSVIKEWKLRISPMLHGKFQWRTLKKIRFKHVKQLLNTLHRSARIIVEKSTNPYK